MKSPYKTKREAFEANVSKQDNGCWLWIGGLTSKGYGSFSWTPAGLNHVSAHRESWKIYKGRLRKKTHVLHSCDTPRCVNPEHLFKGNQLTNMRDMVRKGRQVKGERQHCAKLNADKVLAIRKDPRTNLQIGLEYGVSAPTISDIKNRVTWAHV